MRHAVPAVPQFYVTASQACPYLSGRIERKLFTALHGDGAAKLNDMLSKQGFRRSQNVVYRPSCTDCTACYSARINVAEFVPTKSQRRVLRRNAHLTREASTPWATQDQYQLFRSYLKLRHSDGGMADMDIYEFAAMIEETPVRSRVVEYYGHAPAETGGEHQGARPKPRLSAASLTDVLDDGLSMVYSFFDPDTEKNSPGTFIILDHIEIARAAGLPYVYLGYWVPGSPKMGYKSNFGALEIYRDDRWQTIDPDADNLSVPAPVHRDPISDQVANIELPDMVTPTPPTDM
jgi:arginine-tRNA-protein transferase